MKSTLLTILLVIAILPAQGETPAEQAVLSTIQSTFDAMEKRDPVAFQQALLPGGAMVLMREGKPRHLTFTEAAERIATPDKTHIQERIYNPIVHIDNDLAVVWAPFDFLIDGKMDHCGTDLFDLIKQDGKWFIATISDTGHKGCAAH